MDMGLAIVVFYGKDIALLRPWHTVDIDACKLLDIRIHLADAFRLRFKRIRKIYVAGVLVQPNGCIHAASFNI
ncbi:hypothetical protein D3C77_404410 [compost metagenome]